MTSCIWFLLQDMAKKLSHRVINIRYSCVDIIGGLFIWRLRSKWRLNLAFYKGDLKICMVDSHTLNYSFRFGGTRLTLASPTQGNSPPNGFSIISLLDESFEKKCSNKSCFTPNFLSNDIYICVLWPNKTSMKWVLKILNSEKCNFPRAKWIFWG